MAEERVNIVLRAFDRTRQAFSGVQRGLDRVKKSVVSLQGALVSLGATAAVSKMASDIDSLGKTSAKLGIVAKELEGLRYAASLSGIETRTLDMAMQRFTRRLAEARNGTGEAKAALQEMGIALKDSRGNAFSQVQVLGQVADAFTKIKDPSDKVRLAFKLFDAEGVSMVNMLEQGSVGVKGLMEQFDALGAELTNKQIKAVELANDKFTAMRTVFTKLYQQLTAFLIPKLAALSELIIKGLALAFAGLVISIEKTINAMKAAYNFTADLTGAFEKVEMTDFSDLTDDIFAMIAAIEGVGRSANAAGGSLAGMGNALGGGEGSGDFLGLDRRFGLPTTTEPPVGGPEKIKIFGMGEDEEKDPFQNWMSSYEENMITFQQIGMDAANSFQTAMGNAFEDVLVRAGSVKDAFLGIAQAISGTIVNALGQMVAQWLVNQTIQKTLGNAALIATGGQAAAAATAWAPAAALASLATSGANATPAAAALAGTISYSKGLAAISALPTFDGGGFTGMGARTGGVDGKGGFNAILHPNETVIDHTKGGGAGVNVNFTIQANDTAGFDKLLESRRGQIVSLVSKALANNGRRL